MNICNNIVANASPAQSSQTKVLNIEGTYRTRNSQKCTQTPVMIANKVFDSFPFLPLLPPPCRKVSAGLLNKQCKLFYHERPFRYQPTYSQSVSYLLTYVLHEYMKPLRCNSLCLNYKGPSYIIDNTFEFAYKSFATLFAFKWEKNFLVQNFKCILILQTYRIVASRSTSRLVTPPRY